MARALLRTASQNSASRRSCGRRRTRCAPTWTKIWNNILLPKLISGELRVRDAERAVAEGGPMKVYV
jgi:hypothetical protein